MGQNFILVIGLSCGCALVTVVLVVAIVMLRRKDRNKRVHKYNCRMEALRMLTAKETLNEQNSNGKVHSTQYEQVPKEQIEFNAIGISDSHTFCQSRYSHMPLSMCCVYKDPSHPGSPRRTYPKHYCPDQEKKPWVLSNKEMEVHHLLHTLPHQDECHAQGDMDSVHSGEDSNTDSGKGPSEDGEKNHRMKPRGGGGGHYPEPHRHGGTRPNHRMHPPSHSYSQSQGHRMHSFSPRAQGDTNSPSPIPEEEPIWQLMDQTQRSASPIPNVVRSDYCTYRGPCRGGTPPTPQQRTLANGTLPRSHAGTGVTSGVIV
ncbi:hypothetical protein CAPTEDRAFT_189412 [Capitella teleta]|uniref:Uncharacterized protein n=1 Tax=Capitella teleta TaxID=283909 RepID=R7VIK3_CAPTE|nr:hypothetical protein CAPTEDRAFT_189412 [Capitella teleta]|eukprot:ELU15545.1 hypothetical protein CAPTEDRAFT_189412 [Capitella teleta]